MPCDAQGSGLFCPERLTVVAGQMKKQESFVPGLQRKQLCDKVMEDGGAKRAGMYYFLYFLWS